jgi:hypothetical protein
MHHPWITKLMTGTFFISLVFWAFISSPAFGQTLFLEERITILEKKVKSLEEAISKTSPEQPVSPLSIEERVRILEQKVKSLEEAIPMINQGQTASPSPPPSVQPEAAKGNWRALENWRTHLKADMTEEEVRGLMGQPDKVEHMWMIGRVWYYGYPSGGSINFTTKKRVKSWIIPPRDQLQ